MSILWSGMAGRKISFNSGLARARRRPLQRRLGRHLQDVSSPRGERPRAVPAERDKRRGDGDGKYLDVLRLQMRRRRRQSVVRRRRERSPPHSAQPCCCRLFSPSFLSWQHWARSLALRQTNTRVALNDSPIPQGTD